MTEPFVFGGIRSSESATEHRDGAAAGRQCTSMRSGINSARQAADDGDPRGCQFVCQLLGDDLSSRGRAPGANDCNGQLVRFLKRARDVQERRRICNRPEARRIGGIQNRPHADVLPLDGIKFPCDTPARFTIRSSPDYIGQSWTATPLHQLIRRCTENRIRTVPLPHESEQCMITYSFERAKPHPGFEGTRF